VDHGGGHGSRFGGTHGVVCVFEQRRAGGHLHPGRIHCLAENRRFFGIPFDPDPAPDDPIAIARSEFDDVWDQLAADGVPLVADRDQAWRDFAGWRVNYDTVLLSLAQITMAPFAPWTSDRSPIDHIRPRMRFFGHRRSIRGRG